MRCYVSFPFEIGDNIYSVEGHDMLTNAMNYYYQNRSGINIETAYITSRDDEKSSLAHVWDITLTVLGFVKNGKIL